MCSIRNVSLFYQLRELISSPVAIGVMAGILIYIAYVNARRKHPTYDDEDYEKQGHVILPAPLRKLKLTREELKTYNSQNPDGKYLLGFLGKLYDVSCCPDDFGPNGNYKDLTGTDIMWYIEKTVRYEIRSFDAYVEEYKKTLEDRFFVAGVLLDDKKEKTSVADSGNEAKWREYEGQRVEFVKQAKILIELEDTKLKKLEEMKLKELEEKKLKELEDKKVINKGNQSMLSTAVEDKYEENKNNAKQSKEVEDLEKTLIWTSGGEAQLIHNLNKTM